ncbi:MAG: polysaccharide deacetylase family protein [Calditrichaeota bacterium]|nr:polysaccharide deacetylase family protein [Calditrichota bacterium]
MRFLSQSRSRWAKSRLSQALVNSGAAALWYRMVTLRRRCFRVLGYHRVTREPQPAGTIEEALAVPFDEFMRQMAWVGRMFSPVHLEAFASFRQNRRAFRRPPVAVTFDDGYRDNLTLALPVLREFRVPATIFVTTGHVGKRKAFWWNELSHLVWRAPVGQYCFELQGRRHCFRLWSAAERQCAFWRLFRVLCRMPEVQRQTALRHLRSEFGRGVATEAPAAEMLSPEDIAQAPGDLLRFGAHTVHHVVLTKVPPEEARQEINDSIAQLRAWTGSEVTTFAYPLGDASSFDERVRSMLAEAGIRHAVTTLKGANTPTQDPLALRRTLIDGADDFCTFVCKVLGIFDLFNR